jgi:hypothetical protein
MIGEGYCQFVAFLGDQGLHLLGCPAHDGGEVDGRSPQGDLALADAGDVEQVLDEAGEVAHLPLDHLAELGKQLRLLVSLDELDAVADGPDRVPQLVGEYCEELILALFCDLTFGLDTLLRCDVAADFRGPDNAAGFIADRGDGERNVDDVSVLLPSLRLVMVHLLASPDASENLLDILGVFVWNDYGYMFADDLVGRLAEDLLGPPVPACDDAV